MAKKKSPGTLAENRKARHDYNIEDTIEELYCKAQK